MHARMLAAIAFDISVAGKEEEEKKKNADMRIALFKCTVLGPTELAAWGISANIRQGL